MELGGNSCRSVAVVPRLTDTALLGPGVVPESKKKLSKGALPGRPHKRPSHVNMSEFVDAAGRRLGVDRQGVDEDEDAVGASSSRKVAWGGHLGDRSKRPVQGEACVEDKDVQDGLRSAGLPALEAGFAGEGGLAQTSSRRNRPADPPEIRTLHRRSSLSSMNLGGEHEEAAGIDKVQIRRTHSPDGGASSSSRSKARRASLATPQLEIHSASSPSAEQYRNSSASCLEEGTECPPTGSGMGISITPKSRTRRQSAIMGEAMSNLDLSTETLYGVKQMQANDKPQDASHPQDVTNAVKRISETLLGDRFKNEEGNHFRQAKDSLVNKLEDKLFALQTGESPGNAEDSDAKASSNRVQALWKRGIKHVVYSNKVSNQIKANMAVYAKARAKRRGGESYYNTFSSDSRTAMATRILISFFAIIDTMMMMTEATGFHGCNADCQDSGGTFARGESWGHLGHEFLYMRSCLGLVSDAVYFIYFLVRMRTYDKTTTFEAIPSARSIMMKYARTQFAPEFFAMAPIYWCFFHNPWVRANRILILLRFGINVQELSKLFMSVKLNVNLQFQRIVQYCGVLLFYVHVMTCKTMIICFLLLNKEPCGADEVRRWLDLQGADDFSFSDYPAFYLHCQLWVWSNVSGWGGNWSPHTFPTTAWTYLNQFMVLDFGHRVWLLVCNRNLNLPRTRDLS